ncbi:acyl-CoA dehydrogenase [Alteribacillus iranensis]|uniref:Acyl-CoA dehydrogenase n=1 Tax=Alteribacillus iranensis TaxID=930128 RepID=A0A1I2C0X5_9BACI|nr:acyl-CoA dehydrogenase [Alteribacillus iranensis]SFE62021.1 butyryl-CoA dehydrogenase [Alteribacillus iranensis]
MDFMFSEEQKMIRKAVREFAKEKVAPEVKRMEEEDRFPKELVNELARLGYMGIPIPAEYGGAGMDFPSLVIAIHEISKVSPALGVILSVHTSVGTAPIVSFGTEAQKKKYVPKLASGEYVGAFALTEAGAGSDASAMRTTAKKAGDRYLLNGSKVFITNGGEADTYILFAKTENEQKEKNMTAFIVEKEFQGFSIGKKEKKLGLNGSNTTELILEDCEVPDENRLGEEGEGFHIAMSHLRAGRIGIAAQSVGIAEGALAEAAAYSKQRKQFGKPICEHQGISFKLADMAVKVEAATLLTYQAALLHQNHVPCTKEASMAKLYASRTAVEVASDAVQIFGGYGYMKDYPVERYFRDAKVCEIYEGTSEIQRMVVAKRLLKEYK